MVEKQRTEAGCTKGESLLNEVHSNYAVDWSYLVVTLSTFSTTCPMRLSALFTSKKKKEMK